MDYKRYALNYQWSFKVNKKKTLSKGNKKKIVLKYSLTISILLLSTILYIFPFVKNLSNDSIELVEEIQNIEELQHSHEIDENPIKTDELKTIKDEEINNNLNNSSVAQQKNTEDNNIQNNTQNNTQKKLKKKLDNDLDPEETIEENIAKNHFHQAHSFRVYYYSKNDTLTKIAKNYGITIDTIISLNEIRDKKDLFVGKLIKIPNLSGVYYYPNKKDTLKSISKKYKVKIFDIIKYNYDYLHDSNFNLEEDKVLFLPNAKLSIFDKRKLFGKQKQFFDPLKKRIRISSPYGYRIHPILKRYIFHKGIDIPANTGTPVYAVASGKVLEARRKGNYGKYIRIIHNDRVYYTCYAHLSRINVKKGQYVKKGQMIGRVGNTGRSTGPHLHFEVHRRKSFINPKKFLRQRL